MADATLDIAVEVVRDRASLARFIPQWEDLAGHALEPNPLYEHWMMLPALEALGDGDFYCCLLWVRDPERSDLPAKLGGLFPFRSERRYKGFPASALRSWSHPFWMLCTPLVRAEGAQRNVAALLDWLEREGAPVVEFRHVPSDGRFNDALADALRERKSMVLATDGFPRPLVRQGAQHEGGALEQVVLRAGDDVARWIDDFLRLEAGGWKGRRGNALASSEAGRRFAVAALTAAFDRGRLLMTGLDFEGRPIARHCHLLAGEGSYFHRSAYDEAFACYAGALAGMHELDALPGVRWMDSMSDPDHPTINRGWKDSRSMHNVVIGNGAWGEMWVSMLPVVNWAKSRIAATSRNDSAAVTA